MNYKPHLKLLVLILIPMLSLLSLLSLSLLFPPLSLSSTSTSTSISIIQQACQSSLSPPQCISTLSSQNPSPSPSSLILSLISLSSQNLDTALSSSRSLLASSPPSNPARANAAQNCIDHLSLSSRRLDTAANTLSSSSSSVLAVEARAYLSAALLYQYDCWSALKYVNSTHQVAAMMTFLHTSLVGVTSDALAMVNALQRFGAGDLGLWRPPETERDGYWPSTADTGERFGVDDDFSFPDLGNVDVTVCKDAGCSFQTVQEAVDSAPDFGAKKRFVVYVKAGVYEETVRVAYEKTNVVFVGDGMGKTVITGKLNAQMAGVTTYNTATVGVVGDGFMARDLTVENSAGPGAHQAVAFRSDSDRSVLHSVEFLGHQDTLYARSMRQYYHECRISGTVDFIFGNSATVFDNCLIVVVPRMEGPEKGESNALTAHGRTDPGQATGFVFRNCTASGSDEYMRYYRQRPGRHKVYLGRPWKEYSRVVYLGCYLEEMVRPEGWMPWRGEFALKTLFYGEYGSSGPGANESGRVEWSSRIPEEYLGVYSMKNFIQGDQWVSSS